MVATLETIWARFYMVLFKMPGLHIRYAYGLHIDFLKMTLNSSQIGQIMLDNASNNNTLMGKLGTLLYEADHRFQFHPIGNCIRYCLILTSLSVQMLTNLHDRCFAHVVNIAVQHILSALKNNYNIFEDHLLSQSFNTSLSLDSYSDALQGDPVGRVRQLVSDCHVSGQRHSALRTVITNGNEMKSWPQTVMDFDSTTLPDALKTGGTLPEVQLLRDCETQWSSTFLMITRFLTLYPV
jgi:hypothetical protein